MEKMKNIFGRNMAKLLVFLIGGILVLGLLSYGLLTLSKTVSGQGHKIEICTYYQDNSTKNLSNLAGTISVNGNISDSVQGRVGSSVSLTATANENYEFMGFYRDLEFTDVISRDSSCVYEISAEDAKIFAQFLKVYPVSFTFQDANFNTHTITKKFPYGYTFGQEEIKELIEKEAGEAGLSVFENKLAKLNPTPETASDTTSTNMCFTVGSGASFFNLTPAPLDDVGISGSGTSASPYLIANATDLATFRDTVNGTKYDAHAKLTADITLSGNWTPIGNYSANTAYQYKGTFDGQFYSISGLSISSSNLYQGLFGYASGAVIKNLKIVGGGVSSTRSSSNYIAAVCGGSYNNSKFINCSSTCSVNGVGQELGGICGATCGAYFINCFNGGVIKTQQADNDAEIGGICGTATTLISSYYNCYNFGQIITGLSSEAYSAGILGENYTNTTTKMVNNYSMSGVAGNRVYSSGMNGKEYTAAKGNALFNASTQIITPYESGVTTRYVYNIATDAATSMPATTTLLEALNKFVELNPVMEGVKLSPYYIATTYPEFALMGEVTYNANGGTRLSETAQTYLKPTTNYTLPTILPAKGRVFTGWFTAANGGTEITNETVLPTTYFEQTLYARFASYTISGGGSGTEADPYIIKTEQDFIAYRDWINSSPDNSGLCAKLGNDITLTKDWIPIGNYAVWNDATFTGVFDGDFHKISGLQIESNLQFQGLFGRCSSAVIKNLLVINSEITIMDAYVGGICGYAIGTNFINCLSECNILSIDQELAGICGNATGCKFVNCFNAGSIESTQNSSDCEIAGICGYVNSSSSATLFANCYNYGIIKYGHQDFWSGGAIVAENKGSNTKLVNCYSVNGVANNKIFAEKVEENVYTGIGIPDAQGYSLFDASAQVLESAISVYNMSTNVGTAMGASTTLLQALNKFVELNPVMYGVKLSPWIINETFPEFAHSGLVTFNANGGSGGPTEQAVIDGQITISSDIPSKTGYTFVGWSTDSAANSTNFLAGSTYNINGSLKLYAVWRANTYTVLYNGNNSTSGSTANSVHTYGTNKALTSNGFSRTGYQFLGWSTSNSATSATYSNGQSVSNLTTNPYDAVMLYAVWQGNSYTVHYDANGGSGSMENSSHVYGTESELSVCTFTREGYVFLGWSTRSDATSHKYNDEEIITNLTATANATVNLYAIWLKKDITVTVDPNGGVYNGVETATVYNCSVGSDLVLGVPSRPGYEFTEFNTQGDGLGQTLNGTMVLNGDVTFYALWQPLNYVIKYYDGDLFLGQTEAWYNENISLPRWETLLSNNSLSGGKFKQYGWNFAGWTADANGTAVQHTNGGAVLNLTEAGTTINLYAMHTQTLSLTYNGNGSTSGNVSAQSSDLMLNSKSEKITDFVIKLANNSYAKTNYSFQNWAIGSTSGTQKSAGANITNVDLGLTYSSTFNITIYAIWQGNSYTINYYNGTEKIATENYVYGNSSTLKNFSTIGTVTNLAYGWEFYGWATANNTFTRVFEDAQNITNISVENGSEITQNMVIDLYSIYSREVSFISGLNKASTTTATQFWNPYSINNSNLSSVLAEAPQTIETGNWTALGYRSDITAGTATFALTTTTEIRPAANTFNTLYAVYSRTITIADLNTTTTATQYYNSAGTVSTVGQ